MNQVIYSDENGNEVFPVIINTICPIKYIGFDKIIALEFMLANAATDSTLESMMNLRLRPIDSDGEATHTFCTRSGFTHELNRQFEYLEKRSEEWVSGEKFDFNSDPEVIKNNFSTIAGDKDEVLSFLGLEEI